jgi:hypothetical protein
MPPVWGGAEKNAAGKGEALNEVGHPRKTQARLRGNAEDEENHCGKNTAKRYH